MQMSSPTKRRRKRKRRRKTTRCKRTSEEESKRKIRRDNEVEIDVDVEVNENEGVVSISLVEEENDDDGDGDESEDNNDTDGHAVTKKNSSRTSTRGGRADVPFRLVEEMEVVALGIRKESKSAEEKRTNDEYNYYGTPIAPTVLLLELELPMIINNNNYCNFNINKKYEGCTIK